MRIGSPPAVTNKPFTTKIKKIIVNTPNISTIFFNFNPRGFNENLLPGQFFMVWIPGVDEIPMSIAYIGPNSEVGITVQNVGEATKALINKKVGDYIGVRGPYGTAYDFYNDFAVIIAGGVGAASLRELIKGINKHSTHEPIVIIGAKTKEELLYLDELDNLPSKLKYFVCTDDGSAGYKGFVTNYFEEQLESIIEKADGADKITVYTCGPEIMMKKIFDICEKHGIKVQASLERMMRCGFGICGLCTLDPLGITVCQDGPVFDSEILRKTNDFGKYKRSFSGKKNKIN
ncbi:MAG: dihydroorotate dehydrogenase electron transfer subunit [archaeon]|nr:dihydroorotate dehydrogenase electron transfer subunit [archaeon]